MKARHCSDRALHPAFSLVLALAACGARDSEGAGAEAAVTAPPAVLEPAALAPSMVPTESVPVEPAPATGGSSELGGATMGGSGQSEDRWQKADVSRNGQNYFLMANGWGPNFGTQSISWNGTSFTVESMMGSQGSNYEPASYPTVFCGVYSDSRSQECGLPASLASLTSLRTGWRWAPNLNTGEYNAAYDIWLGNVCDESGGPEGCSQTADLSSFSGFLMVWLRDPRGQQPAGSLTEQDITVAGVSGTWHIWSGEVNRSPIVNWTRPEGQDSLELEFDVLDFVRDAQARGLEVPGNHVLGVAVGFEIWNGPVANLQSLDFYVHPE